MTDLLLGIDIGTYSSKATLTDPGGRILRTRAVPHGLSQPAPGQVEQDADAVWWQDLCRLCHAMLDDGEFQADAIRGVAVSAIGPCLLPLDEAGRPLRPGILYGVDVRASAEVDELQRRWGDATLLAHSRMAFTSQAIGPKVLWLQRHEPEVWAATRTLATASSYLVLRLTGEHRIDRHTASHWMPMWDAAQERWATEGPAVELLQGRRLPGPGWCAERAGEVTPEAAAWTGLRAGTPVAVGAVDALSEAISVGVTEPGDLMLMYGSTTFFVLVQDRPTPDARVWTVSGATPSRCNLAAGMATTGSLTRWFCDEFVREQGDVEAAYAAMFGAAAAIAPGADGLLVLPYFSGERTPINDPHARGVIAGLSLAHSRAHVFRAVLESVAFGIRHNLETLEDIGAPVRRVVAVGGGASHGGLWLQIVSDITGRTQVLPEVTIGACYGDAFLAGRAAGLLAESDLAGWVRPGREIVPDPAITARLTPRFAQYKALYEVTKGVVAGLR
ncbi:FGGY-family carbohydrate kinase [Leptothrix discophora]|uniref:FGGY family carbohydrate kinase n=1 Tax=Leptothrix discophora TaxID=89 RepID=A0ABT9FXU9_LEPDI|nr:FGGY family carbohydrate kinase [Leptothrix discophora]MDP4299050.1 FGGY family carbohydrate kinase [Leptothrix discophora]